MVMCTHDRRGRATPRSDPPNPKPTSTSRADYAARDDGEKGKASKQVVLYALPRVLLLHLKRFTHGLSAGTGKVHKPVRFEATLQCAAPPTPARRAGRCSGLRPLHACAPHPPARTLRSCKALLAALALPVPVSLLRSARRELAVIEVCRRCSLLCCLVAWWGRHGGEGSIPCTAPPSLSLTARQQSRKRT